MFNSLRIRQLDFITRTLMILCATLCLFLPFVSNLKYEGIVTYDIFKILLCGVLLKLVALFYKYIRKDQKIFYILNKVLAIIISIVELVFYSLILCILSYAAAYYGLASQEKLFTTLDLSMKFNWSDHYTTVNSSVVLKHILYYPYISLMPQYIAAVTILHFFKKGEWLRIFINTFALLGIVTLIVSALLPAVEADVFFGVTKAFQNGGIWSVKELLQAEHFLNLNNKTMTAIPLSNLQGIVSFPSFHTIAGLILVICFSNIKWLRFPFLVLNILLIAATPSIGGHYLVDTLAGAVIALVGMAAILKFVQPGVPLFSVSFGKSSRKQIPQFQKT